LIVSFAVTRLKDGYREVDLTCYIQQIEAFK